MAADDVATLRRLLAQVERNLADEVAALPPADEPA
jgi:hypothetical protein